MREIFKREPLGRGCTPCPRDPVLVGVDAADVMGVDPRESRLVEARLERLLLTCAY